MIDNALNEVKQEIFNKIRSWISEGSGWRIKSIDNLYLNIVIYKPFKGSSYIKLPLELQNSEKGLINLKNKDNQCFRWCHIRLLNPQDKDPQRIKKVDKEFVEKLDYENIEFPVTINQIPKIEKQNNIRVNVSGYEKIYDEIQFYPISISKEKFDKTMNLLLINNYNDKTDKNNTHYVLINDFNKLMYKKTSKHDHKKYFCYYCVQGFTSD